MEKDTSIKIIAVVLWLSALLPIFWGEGVFADTICASNIITRNDFATLGVNAGTNTDGRWFGIPFTPSANCTITAVGLGFGKNTAPTDNINVFIYSDSAGSPGSSQVTGSQIAGSSITVTTPTTMVATSTFSGFTALSGTQYWIVTRRSGLATNNTLDWGQASQTTGAQSSKFNDSNSWGAAGNNFYFEVDGTTSGGAGTVNSSSQFMTFGDW